MIIFSLHRKLFVFIFFYYVSLYTVFMYPHLEIFPIPYSWWVDKIDEMRTVFRMSRLLGSYNSHLSCLCSCIYHHVPILYELILPIMCTFICQLVFMAFNGFTINKLYCVFLDHGIFYYYYIRDGGILHWLCQVTLLLSYANIWVKDIPVPSDLPHHKHRIDIIHISFISHQILFIHSAN